MVKFKKIGATFIKDIELNSGVITVETFIAADIVPKLLADLRRESFIGHPGAKMGAITAIDGFNGKNRFPAHTAFLDERKNHSISFQPKNPTCPGYF